MRAGRDLVRLGTLDKVVVEGVEFFFILQSSLGRARPLDVLFSRIYPTLYLSILIRWILVCELVVLDPCLATLLCLISSWRPTSLWLSDHALDMPFVVNQVYRIYYIM